MQTKPNTLPPPVNHVFVDYENVRGRHLLEPTLHQLPAA